MGEKKGERASIPVSGGASSDKSAWRKQLLASRQAKVQTSGVPPGEAFTKQIEVLLRELGSVSLAAFYPTKFEPNILPFVNGLQSVLVPRLYDPTGAPLPTGSWGLQSRGDAWQQPAGTFFWQPAVPVDGECLLGVDLLLIPALAVDRSGMRLGRGGGWYDRVLARLTPEQRVFAVVFGDEVFAVDSLPFFPHDQRVDGAVTETEVLYFA